MCAASRLALEGALPLSRTAADYKGTIAAVLVTLACGALLYGRRPLPGRQQRKAVDPAQNPSPGRESQPAIQQPASEREAALQPGHSGASGVASPQASVSAGMPDDSSSSAAECGVPPLVQRAGPVQGDLRGPGAAAPALAQELPPARQGSSPGPSPLGEQAEPGLARSDSPSPAVRGSDLLPMGEQTERGLAHSAAPPQQDGLAADGQALDALKRPSSQARALDYITVNCSGSEPVSL